MARTGRGDRTSAEPTACAKAGRGKEWRGDRWIGISSEEEKGGQSAGTISTRFAKELGSMEELIFSFLYAGHQKIPGFLGKRVLRICARQRGRGRKQELEESREGREKRGWEKRRRKRRRREREEKGKRREKETGLMTKDFFYNIA